jgi:hypothetical protein
MQRTLTTMLALGSAACLPHPKDAGEVDPTGSTDGATSSDSADAGSSNDSADGSTGAAGPGVEESLELGSSRVRLLTPSPDGVVAVLEPVPAGAGMEVVAWSSGLESLWSTPLADVEVTDVDELDEGGYLVAGSSGGVATTWRLSAGGAVELTQSYLVEAPLPSSVAVAERVGGQVFIAITSGAESSAFLYVSLDLVVSDTMGGPEDTIRGNHAITPNGAVIMNATSDDDPLFWEVTDHTVLGYSLPGIRDFVGSGGGLRLVSFGADRITLSGYVTEPALLSGVNVEVPALQREGLLMARGSRVAVIDGAGAGDVRVTEIDDAGVVVRQLSIEPLAWSDAVATAVTVGHDEAIWVAVLESEPGGAQTSFVHRIGPL